MAVPPRSASAAATEAKSANDGACVTNLRRPPGQTGRRATRALALALGAIIGLGVLATAIGYLLTDGQYVVLATIDADPTLPRREVNGTLLHLQVVGNPGNQTLIVVHGGPGADYFTLESLAALADKFQVVFYDQRGSGLSSRAHPEKLSFDTYLADLDSLVDQFSAGQPVHLLGHSFGGQLVAAYATLHPQKIDRIVLAEPGPLRPEMAAQGPVRAGDATFIWPGTVATLQAQHIDGPDAEAGADYVIGEMMMRANPGYWCNQEIPPGTRGWRWGSAANQAVTRSLFGGDGQQFDLIPAAGTFRRPVLFIASSCDTVIGIRFQQQQLRYFRTADLVVVPNAGHEMFLEQPEAAVEAVRAFLTRPD
jgi:proline iminopeptidase